MRHDEQVRQLKILMARLDAGIDVDASGLRENPAWVYTDPDLAEREWHAFFREHPQVIGPATFPDPGRSSRWTTWACRSSPRATRTAGSVPS